MAFTQQEMIASSALTATGNTASFKVPTLTMLAVTVDVTAVSGTSPTLDIFMQVSDDDGTTWFDWPYDIAMTLSSSATDVSGTTNKRNINGASSCSAAAKYAAVYKHLPHKYIRLRYIIGGTGPSFTLSATYDGK